MLFFQSQTAYKTDLQLKMFSYIEHQIHAPFAIEPIYRSGSPVIGHGQMAPLTEPDFGMPAAMPGPTSPFWEHITPQKLEKKLGMPILPAPYFGPYRGHWGPEPILAPVYGLPFKQWPELLNHTAKINVYPALNLKCVNGNISQVHDVPMFFSLSALEHVRFSKPLKIEKFLEPTVMLVQTPPTTEKEFLATIANCLHVDLVITPTSYEIRCPVPLFRDNANSTYDYYASDPELEKSAPMFWNADTFKVEKEVIAAFPDSDLNQGLSVRTTTEPNIRIPLQANASLSDAIREYCDKLAEFCAQNIKGSDEPESVAHSNFGVITLTWFPYGRPWFLVRSADGKTDYEF